MHNRHHTTSTRKKNQDGGVHQTKHDGHDILQLFQNLGRKIAYLLLFSISFHAILLINRRGEHGSKHFFMRQGFPLFDRLVDIPLIT